MKSRVLVSLALLSFLAVSVHAQVCSGSTNKAICVLPQVFGANGLVLGGDLSSGTPMGFNTNSLETFLPVNVGVGEALSTLPLGSSGAGTILAPNAEGHLVPVFEDSLGPIMMERANAIGRKAVNFGVDYQYFSFSSLQGQNLHNFQAVMVHQMMDPSMMMPDDMMHDYITLANNFSLSINQTVAWGVFGITNRLEASIEVPFESAHTSFVSRAHIVRKAHCEQNATCDPMFSVHGVYHVFGTPGSTSEALAATDHTFSGSNDATGPGDVMVRAKYQIIGREGSKNAGSIGIAFRTPTGDAKNFLGAGALGLGPYGAFTRMGRFSPHALFGYQYNGRSVLFSDPTVSGGQSHLPPSLFYSAGADYRATKRITVAADLIGSRVLDASVLTVGPATNFMGDTGLPNTIGQAYDHSYSYNSIATGGKVRIKRSLVLTGNVTTRVDHGGLRANAVPLVGLSYAFF